jgi:Raf kinase inhibitor-like YbhB/YbcL family protein
MNAALPRPTHREFAPRYTCPMLEKLPDSIGHALHGVRAGLDEIAFNTLGLREGMATIAISSLAFADHAPIPARYTADGEGLSPPLQWISVPAQAMSLVLMVEDADSPTPNPLVHAIVVNLPAGEGALAEAALASADHEGSGVHAGRNSYLQAAWLPPDPPPGHGVHRYAFQIFALAIAPDFSDTPGRDEVMAALRAHALASGLLIGTCERPDGSIRIDEGAPAGPVIAG